MANRVMPERHSLRNATPPKDAFPEKFIRETCKVDPLRMGCDAAVGVVAVVISGWSPGLVGVLAGLLTWLIATARHRRSKA